MRLLMAMMLAVLWGWPGTLWAQGPGMTGGRFGGDSPQQADKSFSQDQQKKRQQQPRNKRQGPPAKEKAKPPGTPPSKTQPPLSPMRGAPVAPPGL